MKTHSIHSILLPDASQSDTESDDSEYEENVSERDFESAYEL